MTTTTQTKASTCPSWCDWQTHVPELEADPETTGHSHSVIGEATGQDFACVVMEQLGNSPEVRIFVEVPDDMTLSLEDAIKVADALVEAVRLAGVTR